MYSTRAILSILGCALGAAVASRRVQLWLVVAAILGQLGFFFIYFDRLS
jgi:hypothetical protein